MKLLRITLFIYSLLLLASCAKDEEYPTVKEYPILKTLSAVADSTGVSVKGEILTLGAKPVTEYGFVYTSLSGMYRRTQVKAIGTTVAKGIFEGRLTADIFEDVYYDVQAYATIEGYTVYGGKIGFKGGGSAAPVINDFSPKQGLDETLITITGSNFSEEESLVKVKIGDVYATVIDSKTDRIIVNSPRVSYTGSFPITVAIQDQQVTTKDKYTIIAPYISRISVDKARVGDEITLYGDHFYYTVPDGGYGSGGPIVYIGGRKATIKSHTKTEIVVTVPALTPDLFDKLLTVSISGWNKAVSLPNALTIESGFKTAAVAPANLGTLYARMPSFVANGKAYLFTLDHFISYDLNNNTWNQESTFQGLKRSGAVIAYVGNKAYMLGGGESSFRYYNDAWEFDPQANTWTRKPNLPFGVYGATSFVLNDKLYFFGGQNSSNSRTLWQYTPETGDIISLQPFPIGVGSGGGSTFINNGKVYAVISSQLWEYDTAQDSWLNIGNAPSNGFAYTVNDQGYVVSPNNGLGLSRYDAATNSWVTVANYPGCVTNSAFTGFAYNNRLYLASFTCSSNLYSYSIL